MLFPDLSILALVVLSSLSSALIAMWFLSKYFSPRNSGARSLLQDSEKTTVFLFDDQELVDATRPAHQLLKSAPGRGAGWPRLVAALSARFPTLSEELRDLATHGTITISPQDSQDGAVIKAEWWDDLVRIELQDSASACPEIAVDRQVLNATEKELAMLRAAAEGAPFLLWQQSQAGKIRWANKAYLELASRFRPESEQNAWPPVSLFKPIVLHKDGPQHSARRLSLEVPDQNETLWFDYYTFPAADQTLHYAIGADEAVRADSALRDFVQTLTKTFAHLPIGLAIFDRRRQLALFNPALTDLTTLPVDFLSSKPTLHAFLDRL
ncbi:MAG: hypothetical protein ACC631_06795, partial [Halocynthiibacter sp.]